MTYESLKEHGSEAMVKAAGLYRQQGRLYTLQDGDIWFVFVLRSFIKSSADNTATGNAVNKYIASGMHDIPGLGLYFIWSRLISLM